ncbi:hypothetical protein NOLU111490_17390 [Novosphingobium lubricantis]
MGFLALVSAATFVCTPVAVWDGDGPIWCNRCSQATAIQGMSSPTLLAG